MKTGYIIAGLIFLFNPCVNIYDILPDFIGYILIIYGLSVIADVEIKLAEAKRRMTSALSVAVGKFAAMLLSFIMEFDSTLTLVFAFSFAVLEMFFVIPAFTMLFEGMAYSCMRFSEKMTIKKAEDVAAMTPIFLVVRAVSAVLPELTALVTDYGYVESGGGGFSDMGVVRLMLMIVCFAVALVIGAVWLSMALSYFRSVRRNTAFHEYILKKYNEEIVPNESLHIKRAVGRFMNLWFAAFFFLLCISFDSYFVIPEFACGIILLFALRFARKYVPEYKKTFFVCAAGTAVLFAAYIFLFNYSEEMGKMLYPYMEEGFVKNFLPYALTALLGYGALVFVCVKGKATMKTLVDNCVGLRGTQDARRKEIDEERKKDFCRRIDILFILDTVCVGGSALLMLTVPVFDLAWTARTILAIIAIIYTYNLKCDIISEAEKAL